MKTLISSENEDIFYHNFSVKQNMYLIQRKFSVIRYPGYLVLHNFRHKSSRSFRRLLDLTIFNINCWFKFIVSRGVSMAVNCSHVIQLGFVIKKRKKETYRKNSKQNFYRPKFSTTYGATLTDGSCFSRKWTVLFSHTNWLARTEVISNLHFGE